ncbi:MAG TPA: sigma-70 family RNA polymerase sigma factor [Gaiellaceae bacterium]|nr:sigma-70 family RNA polymerase sigma factor [Gaiellaceae bacterium]
MSASLEEIEELYRSDLDRFLRVAAAILGDRDAARDAVHDGFAVAVRKRKSYSGRGPLAGWVWQVVVNTIRNHKRRRLPELLELREPAAPSNNGPGEGGRLQAALLALPERQRLVVFLHYYADLDYRTIAEALGIREGTVGATLSAARAALRSSLTEVPT